MPAGSRRVDQQRCEALDPPVDGDVVNVDAAFGQEFFHISVGQSVAEVAAHRQQNHLGRKPVPSERNGLNRTAAIHPHMLAGPHPIRQRNGAARA
jgi:hypothetical protein